MNHQFENIVYSYRHGEKAAVIISALRKNADYINHVHTESGFTILHAAAQRQDVLLTRGLLSRPSVFSILDSLSASGKTAAAIFASLDDIDTVYNLASMGANLYLRSADAHSAIYFLYNNLRSRPFALKKITAENTASIFQEEIADDPLLSFEFAKDIAAYVADEDSETIVSGEAPAPDSLLLGDLDMLD